MSASRTGVRLTPSCWARLASFKRSPGLNSKKIAMSRRRLRTSSPRLPREAEMIVCMLPPWTQQILTRGAEEMFSSLARKFSMQFSILNCIHHSRGSPTMSKINGAEAFVRMLQLNGVKHIFGLCGDTSLPFYDALYRLDHGMQHILTRDERSAGYMADAYARVTGKVGVCEGPSGGGATYLLPGLVEANESSIPVLGITSDVAVGSRGKYPLTELDQEALYRPLTKWNRTIDRADQIPGMVRAAFRAMTTGKPGAAHLCFPYDVMKQQVDASDIWAQPEHGRFPAMRFAPDPADVARAAQRLIGARAPVIICGGGVVIAGASGALQELAESLKAAVCVTVSGQGSLADTHPLNAGVVGSNGGVMATRDVVAAADVVLFVGCRA